MNIAGKKAITKKPKINMKGRLTKKDLLVPDTKVIARCSYTPFTGSSAPTADVMYPILINNAGTNYCQALNLVSRGTDFNTRIGNSIAMKKLELHYWLWYNGNTTIQPDTIRVAVVYDASPNAVTGVKWSDVFQDVDSNGTTIDGPTVGINWKNRERFTVLMNNMHHLSLVNAAGTVTSLQDYSKPTYVREFVTIDRKTIYGANSGLAVAADINQGALWLLTQGTFPAGTNGYNLYFSSRVTFNDI